MSARESLQEKQRFWLSLERLEPASAADRESDEQQDHGETRLICAVSGDLLGRHLVTQPRGWTHGRVRVTTTTARLRRPAGPIDVCCLSSEPGEAIKVRVFRSANPITVARR